MSELLYRKRNTIYHKIVRYHISIILNNDKIKRKPPAILKCSFKISN